jgi:hypothetical protein
LLIDLLIRWFAEWLESSPTPTINQQPQINNQQSVKSAINNQQAAIP